MAEYRALVTAAHARGLKVILDTVPKRRSRLALGQRPTHARLALKPATRLEEHINKPGNCKSQPATERYLIVANNAPGPVDVSVPTASGALAACTRFTSALPNGATSATVAKNLQVHLPAQEIGIFRAQP